MLENTVLLQITDQVGQLIDDYEKELSKGFKNLSGKLSIGFNVKLVSQKDEKVKVTTTMSFKTEPPKESEGVVKDKMEVIVGGKQEELPLK